MSTSHVVLGYSNFGTAPSSPSDGAWHPGTPALCICFLVGVLSHITVFVRGEWHMKAPRLLVWCCLQPLFMHACLHVLGRADRLRVSLVAHAAFLLGLGASIAAYRCFFHRLRSFPGPKPAALSKLYHVWQSRHRKNHLFLDGLRERYGDFVRTGPQELTVFDPAAITAVERHGGSRSDQYDVTNPIPSVLFTRDTALHDGQRINDVFVPRILDETSKTLEIIRQRNSESVLLNDLMERFTFDLMGRVVFGRRFDTVRSGVPHRIVRHKRIGFAVLGVFAPAVWILRLALAFAPPFLLVHHWHEFIAFCDEMIAWSMEARSADRVQGKDDEVDGAIISDFLRDFELSRGSESSSNRLNLLRGNTFTAIVTASNARTVLEEVRHVEVADTSALASLQHLNAVIKESMRLLPAVPSGASLITRPEGLWIGTTFIPGNVKVVAPQFSIHRSGAAFDRPNSFVPERWYKQPEMVKDKKAFAPFGVGRRACVGSQLANMVSRIAVASFVKQCHMRLADGEDGKMMAGEMRDQILARPGPCRVVLERHSEPEKC